MLEKRYVELSNRMLLGLVMFIPGLLKLFVMGPDAIVEMLVGFGIPLAMFSAWLLIIAEIVTGTMILFGYKLRYAVIAPIIIMIGASFTMHIENYPVLLLHLAGASNYLLLSFKK